MLAAAADEVLAGGERPVAAAGVVAERLARVEEVTDDAWTKVFTSPKGRACVPTTPLLESEPLERLLWHQEVEESPFERILAMSSTELLLEDANGGTRLTVRSGSARAAGAASRRFSSVPRGYAKVEGAIDGLKELFGAQEPG